VQLNININPGTQIVFQVTDSNNIKATSKVVTVLVRIVLAGHCDVSTDLCIQGNGGTSSSSIVSVAPLSSLSVLSTASIASQTSVGIPSTSSTSGYTSSQSWVVRSEFGPFCVTYIASVSTLTSRLLRLPRLPRTRELYFPGLAL